MPEGPGCDGGAVCRRTARPVRRSDGSRCSPAHDAASRAGRSISLFASGCRSSSHRRSSAPRRRSDGCGGSRPRCAHESIPAEGDIATRVDDVVDLLFRTMPVAPRSLPGAVVGFAMLGLAGRLLRGSTQEGDLQTVLRSAPDNVTTEMDVELWRIAVLAREDDDSATALGTRTARDLADSYRAGTLPAVLQRAMTDFLQRYGHRAVAEIDLGMPRWSDDPAHLFGVLSGYLRLDRQADSPEQHFADGARDATTMMRTLIGRARRRSRDPRGRGAVLPPSGSGFGGHAGDAQVPGDHRDEPGTRGDARDRRRTGRIGTDRESPGMSSSLISRRPETRRRRG